ncbi:MAG: zinc-binding dehydrogenase [Hyphomonadaceae bacterium]
MKNRRWVIAQTPTGAIGLEHFRLAEEEAPAAAPGKLLVRNLMLSIEPSNALSMKAKSYMPQILPGELMRSFGLAEIVHADAPGFSRGDIVEGHIGWQEWALVDPAAVRQRDRALTLETLIGLVGISGITAYYGMLEIGRVRAGETVLVSAAGGAVGNIAVQIAKIAGCRVIGVAGGADKCAWLQSEYGLDGVADYKAGDLAGALRAAAPEGVDYYFDNTGGAVLEAAIGAMKTGGRIGLCGVVGQVGDDPERGVRGVPLALILKRITMQGFLLTDYTPAQRQRAEAPMLRWQKEGRLKAPMHVLQGLESAPQALIDMLAGRNRGKTAVRLS